MALKEFVWALATFFNNKAESGFGNPANINTTGIGGIFLLVVPRLSHLIINSR